MINITSSITNNETDPCRLQFYDLWPFPIRENTITSKVQQKKNWQHIQAHFPNTGINGI